MVPSTYSAARASSFQKAPRSGRAALALSATLAFVALGLFAWQGAAESGANTPVPELVGRDWNGSRYSLAEDVGRVRLLFFGYTHCPDICPGSFARARRLAGELLPAESADLSVVFVSVDPERDTPEVLASYVAAFDTRFHGLWLEQDALARTLAGFEARAERRGADSASYTLDHTSSFYLVDRAGHLRRTLPFDGEFSELVREVRALLAEPRPAGLAPAPQPALVRPEPPRAPAPAPRAPVGPLARFGDLELRSARLGPTPGSVAAVYFTLANVGAEDERLLAVRAPAEACELHETILSGNEAEMQARPEGFVVPAGGELELAPGGKHVMLLGLDGPLAVGDALELTLVFEQAGEQLVVLPVEERTW